MAALVFGVDRSPDPTCPAWPSLREVEKERQARFRRFVNRAKSDPRYIARHDGWTVTKRVKEAHHAFCMECGHLDPSPYWGPSKTRYMHQYGTGHRVVLLAFPKCSPS